LILTRRIPESQPVPEIREEAPKITREEVPEIDISHQLKDAYQVLLTLCKLSTRAVPLPEGYDYSFLIS
jgi:hypothetical protein